MTTNRARRLARWGEGARANPKLLLSYDLGSATGPRKPLEKLFFGVVAEIFCEVAQDDFVERLVADEIFAENRALLRPSLTENGCRPCRCIAALSGIGRYTSSSSYGGSA